MKNLLLFLFLSTSVAFAQVEKPTSGEMFEVSFMPNLEGTTQFALTDMHMVYRKFTDASSVTRWKSHFSYTDIDGDSDFTVGLKYGKEKHKEGATRLATFKGWEAGVLYNDASEDFNLSGAYFVGANYYFAQNLYLGLELNYTLAIGEDVMAVSPGVNGMFSLGFKL